jgi:DNA-binding transcriptional MerR regulator
MTAKTDRTYTISQLAREFEVTPRALRFYEDKGLLTPRREGMNRVYSHRDRARLQLILRGKRVGLSLIEIKEILYLYKVDQRAQAQTALRNTKSASWNSKRSAKTSMRRSKFCTTASSGLKTSCRNQRRPRRWVRRALLKQKPRSASKTRIEFGIGFWGLGIRFTT